LLNASEEFVAFKSDVPSGVAILFKFSE